MKNLFLTLFAFFALNATAQTDFNYYDFNGHWISDETIFELVVLYNEADDFQFLNFNLEHGETLEEKILSYKNGAVKTQLINKRNNWTIENIYSMISNDELKVEISGDYNGTIVFKRLY
jgi:hypothetical protein